MYSLNPDGNVSLYLEVAKSHKEGEHNIYEGQRSGGCLSNMVQAGLEVPGTFQQDLGLFSNVVQYGLFTIHARAHLRPGSTDSKLIS